MPNRVLILLAALTVFGCKSEPTTKLPEVPEVFPTLPLPPRAEVVSRSGSADALQITLRSSEDAAAVTEYYRNTLSSGEWRLVSDMKDAEGATVLYAEQNGPPLWVRIRSDKTRPGSVVELAGAVTPPAPTPTRRNPTP